MKYNLALLIANTLFALNYSFFVSVVQAQNLTIGAIYLLQTIVLFTAILLWRVLRPAKGDSMPLGHLLTISVTAAASSLGWSYFTLEGMSLSSPIDAAIIASAGPSLTLIFAHLLGLRRVTWVRILGIAASLFGVSLLLFSRQWGVPSGSMVSGNTLLVVSVVISALLTLILKPHLQRYGLQRVVWIYAVTALGVSLPCFWGELGEVKMAGITPLDGFEIVALLLIGSALPLILLLEGCEHLSALHTSLYRYMQPLVASLVLLARGQGSFTTLNFIVLALIVAGGVMVAKGVDRAG